MVGVLFKFIGRDTEQLLLNFQHGFSRCDTGAITQSKNMSIDSDGRVAESRIEYHAGSFSPDTGQGFKGGTIFRNPSTVLFDQDVAGGDDIFCLGAVQTDGLDELAQALDA